jgi:DNA repair protein RadD
MIELFPDQVEIMQDLRSAMRRSKTVLLQSPTGSGKTAMATHMIQSGRMKSSRIVFTVPRKDLLEQTSASFARHGIDHGYVAAGKPYNPYAKTYIGMVDTMARRLDKLPPAQLIIVDETHFGAGALDGVIQHYTKAGAWVVGLSATPWKLSGQGLGMWYREMVMGKTVEWLIENKRLSDYRYFHGKTAPDLSGISVSGGDYAKGELADYMEHQGVIIGDCVNDYRLRAMGRLHIVRCASIKHSQMTAASFRDAGIPAVHVDGETPMDERGRIFRAYARREILVLTFCDLLNFGFDLSQASGMDVCIESGSDLKPSKSLAAQMQFWGRMLRFKPYPAIINDHVNNYLDHQLPCSPRVWSLENREQKKKSTDRVPATRQCPACFYVHPPAPVCPDCGHVYVIKSREIDSVDGELQEIDRTAAREATPAIDTKALARDMMYNEGANLAANDRNSLNFLIKKFTAAGAKNPTAKAAHVLAARMAKKQGVSL